MTTPDRLAEITARLEAATPGPWFAYFSTSVGKWTVQVDSGWLFVASDKATLNDIDFTAHAPADLKWCRDEIRRLRARVEALEAVAKAAMACKYAPEPSLKSLCVLQPVKLNAWKALMAALDAAELTP